MVIDCTQEKKSGAPSCPQDKGTGALLISGERNWCNTVSGEGNWCTTVLRRRKHVLYSF